MCTSNVLNMLKIKIFNRKLTIKKRIKFSLFNNKKKKKNRPHNYSRYMRLFATTSI